MEELNMNEMELEELKKAVGAGEDNVITKDMVRKSIRYFKYNKGMTLEQTVTVIRVLCLGAPFDAVEFTRTWFAYL